MGTILRPDDDCTAGLGGKARALRKLQLAGLPVPPWFVVPADAITAPLSPDLKALVNAALLEISPNGEPVAVRSSAADEDGTQQSFAGMLDSFLCVRPTDVEAKVAEVWQSGDSQRVQAYRQEHGLGGAPQLPSVLIQRMVAADSAGVAFSADPVSGRRGIAVVSAVWGLGTGLVSGECDADTWRIDRRGEIVERDIACKRMAHRAESGGNGVRREIVPTEKAARPALTDVQVQAVAALARQAERLFGRPQDIEWALEGDQIYLLQSRPITSLAGLPDPDGNYNLWDNSNIAESYSGVTTPLTFSFARRAYEAVYRQFCRMMGVPKETLVEHDDLFHRMLGLVQGRVYYNLLNWYRLLALLPGFTFNRRFMEQMMGVRESLQEDALSVSAPAGRGARWRDGIRLLRSVGGLAMSYVALPRQKERFYRRLDEALGTQEAVNSLDELRLDELSAHYRSLERRLLMHWDAPLVNDFFAMIFFGVLRRLTGKWCGDPEGTLQNALLSGEGGIISAEPARLLREMAEIARQDASLIEALRHCTLDDANHNIQSRPDFKEKYLAYLGRFGERCLEELKLESETLHDDSLPLIRAIGNLATKNPPDCSERPESPRLAAQARVRESLKRRPLRRLLFGWVLRNARARVRDRENLRFERTRVFGRARRIFVAMGRRFYAEGVLDDPKDIFYLEVEEALGFIEGTATSTDLRALAAVRKAEFARYRDSPAPDDRFETRGAVYLGNAFRAEKPIDSLEGEVRCGTGCSPGIVRGTAYVVTDPRTAQIPHGTILVAAQTDPGWILLFPSAAGLLVERGSLLSHSAIVAREMGIPAIVSMAGITRWLSTGDLVEMDGSTGVIRKLGA